MSHKIEISDKTFEDLREFCKLNGLKIGQYADKFIREGLMMEMYGDVPFTNYKKPKREEIVELVREAEMESSPINEESSGKTRAAQAVKDVIEQFKNTAEIFQTMQEKIPQENIPPEIGQAIQDHWFEMLDDQEKTEESPRIEEVMKQSGVPNKVVNKITKRRLK